MYQQISQKILANEPGDSIQSMRISGGLTLKLEERVKELKNRHDKHSCLFIDEELKF